MKFVPYVHQDDAVDAAVLDLGKFGNSLWWMPTGSGKAFALAMLAERLISINKSCRILVLIDQAELAGQLFRTFSSLLRDVYIDVACKTLKKRFSLSSKILIGTRQTVIGVLDSIGSFDFIFGDEAHEWAVRENGKNVKDDQFKTIYNTMLARNPNVCLHGCTATPYRLGIGYICDDLGPAHINKYFERVTYRCTCKDLFNADKLVKPVFIQEVEISDSGVGISKTSLDYNTAEAGAAGRRHALDIVDGYDKHLLGRTRKVVAFCSSIEQCEDLTEKFVSAGHRAESFHSKRKDCPDVLGRYFEHGGILVTVDKVSKGFDHPAIDGVILASLSMNPAVIIQKIGRCLRVFPGKKTSYVLDFVGGVRRHLKGNDLDSPIVKNAKKKPDNGVIVLRCPVGHSESREKKETEEPEKQTRDFVEVKHGESGGVVKISPKIYKTIVRYGTSGRSYVRVLIMSDAGNWYGVNLFLSDFYNGYPVDKSRLAFYRMFGRPMPSGVSERITPPEVMPKSLALSCENGSYVVIGAEN